jgi:pimeloyl-ACP methyl ester carboxylesterase
MAVMMSAGMNSDLMRYLQGGDYPALLDAHRARVRAARRTWLAPTLNLWAEDTLFVVDELQSGGPAGGLAELAAAVDAGRVGYFGMSFGGAVAARLCQMDDRAVAGIDLDGALWSWDTIGRDIPTPFLSIHSDPTLQIPPIAEAFGVEVGPEFKTLTPATPLHDDLDLERHTELGLRPDVRRYVLPGLTHMGVTDFLVLQPLGILPMPPDPDGRGVAMTNRLCTDFFDTWMKGLDRAFPQAALADFPEIVERDLSVLREQARRAGDQTSNTPLT